MEGWNQEKVMEFDGLPVATVADRLADLTQTQIEAYVHKHPEKKKEIMPHLAHALMSVATKFGIKISHKRISAFQMDARLWVGRHFPLAFLVNRAQQ